MIMTTDSLDEYIESKKWKRVETIYRGSSAYDSTLGVMRIMFGIHDDPVAVTTLLSKKRTEVWAQYEDGWKCHFDNAHAA